MNEDRWCEYVEQLSCLLGQVSFQDAQGLELQSDQGFELWCELTRQVRDQRRTVYLIGNGASASLASHMGADLAKNAHVHTQVFTDLALVTAISNDMGYERVFTEPLRRMAGRGDMLVAISSSGRSPNVLSAANFAGETGLIVVTLTGADPENPLRVCGDLNAYVPAGTYGQAETCHGALLHHWMDMVDLEHCRLVDEKTFAQSTDLPGA